MRNSKLRIVLTFFLLIFLMLSISCKNIVSERLEYYKKGANKIFISKKFNKEFREKFIKNYDKNANEVYRMYIKDFDIKKIDFILFVLEDNLTEVSKKDLSFVKSKLKLKNKERKKFLSEVIKNNLTDNYEDLVAGKYSILFFCRKIENKLISDYLYYNMKLLYNLSNLLVLNNMPENYLDYYLNSKFNIYFDKKFYKPEINQIFFLGDSIVAQIISYLATNKNFSIDNKIFINQVKNSHSIKFLKQKVSKKQINNLAYTVKYFYDTKKILNLNQYILVMLPVFILDKYGIDIYNRILSSLINYNYKNPDDLYLKIFKKNFEDFMKEFENYLIKQF